MSDALYLADVAHAAPGDRIVLDGPEGRHAVQVKRTRAGESLLLADGSGNAVRGKVVSLEGPTLVLEVAEVLVTPDRPHRFVAAQALAKGDRSERAIEALTELGVDEVIAWQASRSIVRWHADKAAKGLDKWRSTVREATKQSRRFRVPEVTTASTTQLVGRLAQADAAFVLHEDATLDLADATLPSSGEVLVVIGPEGGISPEELAAFEGAGATSVSISDGVLRTSTAGVVALARLLVMGRQA